MFWKIILFIMLFYILLWVFFELYHSMFVKKVEMISGFYMYENSKVENFIVVFFVYPIIVISIFIFLFSYAIHTILNKIVCILGLCPTKLLGVETYINGTHYIECFLCGKKRYIKGRL